MLPKATTFRPPPPAGKQPSAPTNGVTAAPKAPPQHPADSGKNSLQGPVQSASSVASTGHTSNIQCHRCHALGHLQKDCPSQRAYVATGDGGYISTSDIEEDVEDDAAVDVTEGHVLGGEDTSGYMNIIVQHVLSTQIQPPEKLQRHNLFQIFFVIKNRRAHVIIDGGSCNNLVSSDRVKKLGLTTRPHPYHIQWLNDSGKAKITQTCRVPFSIGVYSYFVDCDVVPMQACSLLLGHPWEQDNDAMHHGRSNKYTFMHKGQKITMAPFTPAEIVQADRERAATLNDSKSENQQVANSVFPPKKDKSTYF
jgi:hypothetical protein